MRSFSIFLIVTALLVSTTLGASAHDCCATGTTAEELDTNGTPPAIYYGDEQEPCSTELQGSPEVFNIPSRTAFRATSLRQKCAALQRKLKSKKSWSKSELKAVSALAKQCKVRLPKPTATTGNPAAGKTFYSATCTACHGKKRGRTAAQVKAALNGIARHDGVKSLVTPQILQDIAAYLNSTL